jgi:hypothetical protein
LFGDIISKGDGAFGSHFANHDDIFFSIPFVVEPALEPHCELVDLVSHMRLLH